MRMFFGILSCAFANSNLIGAKQQIFKHPATISGYLTEAELQAVFNDYDDGEGGGANGDGEIEWGEFWKDIGPLEDNGQVSTQLRHFIREIAGNDGTQGNEFKMIGNHMLVTQDRVNLHAGDRTIKWTPGKPGQTVDDDWLIALEASAPPRTFANADQEDTAPGDDTIDDAQMIKEVARVFFGMIGEFDRKGPEGQAPFNKAWENLEEPDAFDQMKNEEFWHSTKPLGPEPVAVGGAVEDTQGGFGAVVNAGRRMFQGNTPVSPKAITDLTITWAEFKGAYLAHPRGASFLETVDVTKDADKRSFSEATRRPVRVSSAAPHKRHFGIETDGQVANFATDHQPHRAEAAAGTTGAAPQGAFAELDQAAAQAQAAQQHEGHTEHAEGTDHK